MSEFVLTGDNYFSPEAEERYWGSSSFKAWDMNNEGFEIFSNQIEGGCEAREAARMRGDWPKKQSTAMLLGSYVHAYFEGKEAFQKLCDKEYNRIYKANGGLRADFVHADEKIIPTLENDPLVMQYFDGEKEKYFTGEIGGVQVKIKADIINLNADRPYFVDIKTTDKLRKVSYKDGKRVCFIGAFDYYSQMAIYSEILYQNLGFYLDVWIVVVDKTPQPDHAIIYMGNQGEISGDYMWEKLSYVGYRLPDMEEAKRGRRELKRCEKCEYCKATKKIKKPVSLLEFKADLGIE